MTLRWILALLIFVFSGWPHAPAFAQSSARDATNYRACLHGNSFSCNASLLTDTQQTEVRRAALQRNYTACRYGNTFGCNKSLLTPTQQADVQSAALHRNYTACRYGNTLGCTDSLLTSEQRIAVSQAALQRNYTACLYGNSFGCNPTLLTDVQAAAVAARAKVEPIATSACAENGSCYGDISAETGRPKTVQVDGYYRKDGTYVRGHYRSRPRR